MLAAIVGLGVAGPMNRRPNGTRGRQVDWLGFVLLAIFMVSLVFALHALPHAASAPVAGPLALAAAALAGLLRVELRAAMPLFDVRFFARRAFAMGAVIGSLSMTSIMMPAPLLQPVCAEPKGLGLTALETGVSLLPLCVALLALALSASSVAARVGLRAAIMAGMLLVVIGSATLGAATAGGGLVPRAIGLFVLGAGLALPYATIAPTNLVTCIPFGDNSRLDPPMAPVLQME